MNHIEIPLTHQMMDLATAYQRAVQASIDAISRRKGSPHRNYTGIVAPERYYVGCIGELGLARYFRDTGAAYRHRLVCDGRSDPAEFVVWVDGLHCHLDVKTRSQSRHDLFLVLDSQLAKDCSRFYLGAQLCREAGALRLWGWLTRTEVMALPSKSFGSWGAPSRYHPLNQMRPMETLDPDKGPWTHDWPAELQQVEGGAQ